MNPVQAVLTLALLFTLVLGVVVWLANRKRRGIQPILILSLMASCWLFSVVMAFRFQDQPGAAFWTGMASTAGMFFPPALTLFTIAFTFLPNLLAASLAVTFENVRLHTEVQNAKIYNDILRDSLVHSERLATIGKLSATMAHEIKSPLVAIKTFAQLLPERGQDEQFVASFSKVVSGEVDRINRTVADLLDYSRLGPNNFRPIRVHEALDKATGLLKPQFEKKGVRLVTNLNAKNDLIQANQDRFQQILVNLLLNGCEAIENQGTITLVTQIIAGNPNPDKSGVSPGDWIELIIQDDGRGIPPEYLKRIFDPFFTTKPKGTGLGLSLTTSLVTDHKGRLDVESELGKGTSFRLQFPLWI